MSFSTPPLVMAIAPQCPESCEDFSCPSVPVFPAIPAAAAVPAARPRAWGRLGTQALVLLTVLLSFRTLAAQPPTFVTTSAPVAGVHPPLPVWPSEGETVAERRPVFRLNGRWGASRYRVELASDSSFAEPRTFSDFTVAQNEGIEPVVLVSFNGEPLADGRYVWRAFCAGADGLWTPPANYRLFQVGPIEHDLIEPPGNLDHPRLFISPRELTAFRVRLSRCEHLQRGWQYMLNAAMSLLDVEPPDEAYARLGPGQHGYYNTAAEWYLRHLDNLAFVAYVGNNQRLARKGVELLMAACRYEHWLGPLFDNPRYFDPPWHSALETAMMTDAVAVAYDLLHHELTEPQRQIVRTALMEKGIRPLVSEWADPAGSSRIPRHQLPTGNWVMVCSSGAGVGALALLGEHPDAPQAVRLVRDRIRAWLADRGGDWCADGTAPTQGAKPVVGPSEPNFGAHGGYKESITYMNYAMRYVCYFADPLRRLTDENLFDGFPENLLEPVSWSVLAWPEGGSVRSRLIDFGDCGAGAGFHDLYTALMRNTGDGRAAWLYHRSVALPTSARTLAWYDDIVAESPPSAAVPMAAFPDIGQVVLRAGWSPDSPVAAIKFHQNRGHLDLGTFYLFGPGGPAIIDSGATGYGSPIYRDYSSKTIAHNVVLVDAKTQERTDGHLIAAIGTSRLSAASGQLTAAYPDMLRSWTRDLVMLPDGDVVVFDQLAGIGAHQFDYLLHPGPDFELDGSEALRLATGAHVSVKSTQPLRPTVRDGFHRSLPRNYVSFESSGPAERQSFALLCRWPGTRANPSAPRGDGPAATQPATIDDHFAPVPGAPGAWSMNRLKDGCELLVRLGGSSDRIATDARLCVVHRPNVRQDEWHALAIEAQRVSVDGRDVFEADHPVGIAIEKSAGVRVCVSTQEATLLGLPISDRLGHAFLNREPVETRRSNETVYVQIPAGEHEIELSELSRPLERMPSLLARDLAAVKASANAPAFLPGVRVTSSTSGKEGLAAIDGDPNTAWTSLPGSMPQWLLVNLTRPVRLNQIRLETGRGCSGRIELYDTASRSWGRPRGFAVTADRSDTLLKLPAISTNQIRVIFEVIEGGTVATLKTLEWAEVQGDTEPQTQPADDDRVRVVVPLTTSQAEMMRRALASRPAAATQPTKR